MKDFKFKVNDSDKEYTQIFSCYQDVCDDEDGYLKQIKDILKAVELEEFPEYSKVMHNCAGCDINVLESFTDYIEMETQNIEFILCKNCILNAARHVMVNDELFRDIRFAARCEIKKEYNKKLKDLINLLKKNGVKL